MIGAVRTFVSLLKVLILTV